MKLLMKYRFYHFFLLYSWFSSFLRALLIFDSKEWWLWRIKLCSVFKTIGLWLITPLEFGDCMGTIGLLSVKPLEFGVSIRLLITFAPWSPTYVQKYCAHNFGGKWRHTCNINTFAMMQVLDRVYKPTFTHICTMNVSKGKYVHYCTSPALAITNFYTYVRV